MLQYEGAGTSDKRYLHADERGSIIATSNASGQVTQINAYDDYGIPQGKNAAGAVYPGGTATANFGRFGYTGQAWLPEIGLSYYKARMYSPTLGRFMQTDPIGYGDGVNLYAYVGGDPVNFSDPSGLAAEKPAPKAVIPIAPAGDEIVVNGFKAPPPPPRGLGFLLSANRPGDRGGPSFDERDDGGPGEMTPVAFTPDRCENKTTPPQRGNAQFFVNNAQLQNVAQTKFLDHSFPLNRDGRLQSTFGGVMREGSNVASGAAFLITTRDAVPTSSSRLRITGNLGKPVGRDIFSSAPSTNFLTVIIGLPTGATKNGLPERPVISIFPGC